MHSYTALIREIRLQVGHDLSARAQAAAWIDCPKRAVPGPGQFVLAGNPLDYEAPLATALFPVAYSAEGFLAAPPLPVTWLPGVELVLRGPMGRGFQLPQVARRLGLIDLGSGPERLLPLIELGLVNGADVALFSDRPPGALPASVEINPLRNLGEALAWADFLALDVLLEQVEHLDEILGLSAGRQPACPGQVLVEAPMPCGGLAECGVCALKLHRHWQLTCLDGPVFELRELV